jgi:hypothetical protein
MQMQQTQAPAASARLTIEATMLGRTLTLRVTLSDETNVPMLTGAATLDRTACDEGHVDDVLRAVALESILDKCEDLGWRRLPEAARRDLSAWNEHSALGHLLRRLLAGIDHAGREGEADRAGRGERPVGVVDPAGGNGSSPSPAAGFRDRLLQPGRAGAAG